MKWTTLVLAPLTLALLVTQLPVATASPAATRPDRLLDGVDFDALQNKVRSGAIAIANADRPRDEHAKHASYRNGDVVDTSIIDTPDHLPEGGLHARHYGGRCGHDGPCRGHPVVVGVPWNVTRPYGDNSTSILGYPTLADNVRFHACC